MYVFQALLQFSAASRIHPEPIPLEAPLGPFPWGVAGIPSQSPIFILLREVAAVCPCHTGWHLRELADSPWTVCLCARLGGWSARIHPGSAFACPLS